MIEQAAPVIHPTGYPDDRVTDADAHLPHERQKGVWPVRVLRVGLTSLYNTVPSAATRAARMRVPPKSTANVTIFSPTPHPISPTGARGTVRGATFSAGSRVWGAPPSCLLPYFVPTTRVHIVIRLRTT